MPSIVGNFKIVENDVSSVINNGDAYLIAPTSTSKSHFGSGSVINGDFGNAYNKKSKTFVNDADYYEVGANKSGTTA